MEQEIFEDLDSVQATPMDELLACMDFDFVDDDIHDIEFSDN